MGCQAALGQLAELRVLAGLGVAGSGQQAAHIGFELVVHDGIVLLIGHAQQIFLGRGVELQRHSGVRNNADIVVDQCADGLFQPGAAKGFVAGGVPDQRLHQRAAHTVPVACGSPLVLHHFQHDDRLIGVKVDKAGHPAPFELLIRHGVNDGKPAVDAPFFAAPQSRRCGGAVEPDAAADGIVGVQRGEHAAVFQLIPACLAVFSNQPVIGHQLGQGFGVFAYKTIKHAACSQHIHGFLAPVAADLQLFDAAGQRNADVYIVQGDVPLVVFVFGLIVGLVVVEHLGQRCQLPVFLQGQPRDDAKMQVGHLCSF